MSVAISLDSPSHHRTDNKIQDEKGMAPIKTKEYWLLWFTYLAWCSLGSFFFLEIPLVLLFQYLIIIPGLYYTFIWIRTKGSTIPKSVWCLAAFSVLAFISSVVNRIDSGDWGGVSKIRYFFIGVLAIAPSYHLLKSNSFSQRKKKVLLYLFLVSTAFANIVAILTFFVGYNPLKAQGSCFDLTDDFPRTCGMYSSTMTYGYGAGLLSLFLLGLLVNAQKLRDIVGKNILLLSSLLSFIGLYLSFARGAFLGFLLALPWLFATFRNKAAPMRFYGLSCAALAMAMVMLLSFLNYIPKGSIQNRLLASKGSSYEGRISFYRAAYYGFKENPFFGLGFQNFDKYSVDLKKKYNILFDRDQRGSAHNNYLEILAGSGLMAFLAFFGFLLFWLIEIFKSTKEMRTLFLPFFIGFLISGLFHSSLIDRWSLFFIMGVFTLFQALELKRKAYRNGSHL
ncbi:MAG: O-antigen ligase family protein [Bacteriovoracales bacterium]|nr:O-antigen ligase family protein [Bacteriovoracales bacterium]